jgi:hypothetical protein
MKYQSQQEDTELTSSIQPHCHALKFITEDAGGGDRRWGGLS